MVKKSWLLILGLYATCPGIAAAEVQLTLRADNNTIVLGEPLLVELKAVEVHEPLSSISLEKLKKDFNVYGISSNTQTQTKKGRKISTETMTLTLYPLRIGKLQLPAFSYSGKSSQPLWITVLESGKQTSRVMIKAALASAHPQVRQADTLTLDIFDDGSLQWSAPHEIIAAGAHQRRLAESQREEMVEGTRYTVHRYTWALMPLREGGIKIEFPMLDAMKFGTRQRYAVSPVWLNAAPVPAYLAVHVPIGKTQFTMEPLPAEIALDRPVNWMFTVQGSGISIEGVSKLLSNLRSNPSLRFYPPVVSIAENERPVSAQQILRITVPFVPMQTGTLQLPEINFPYYDPASFRVESVFIPGVSVVVFDPLRQTVRNIAFGLMLLLGASVSGYILLKQWQRILKKKNSLSAIRGAASAEELRQALLKFDIGKYDVPRLTLEQWLQHMQLTYVVDERLAVLVRKLESEKYGVEKSDTNTAELAQDAAMLLKKLTIRKAGRSNLVLKSSLPSFRKMTIKG